MKASKNETEMIEAISKIQALLTVLDKKVDTLMSRSSSQAKPTVPQAPVNNSRMTYKAICADCSKECTIPFKPSGDRPVYCQDCFSRRKMIKMSGMNVDQKPQAAVPQPTAKPKKTVAVKKAVTKKKATAKKK